MNEQGKSLCGFPSVNIKMSLTGSCMSASSFAGSAVWGGCGTLGLPPGQHKSAARVDTEGDMAPGSGLSLLILHLLRYEQGTLHIPGTKERTVPTTIPPTS